MSKGHIHTLEHKHPIWGSRADSKVIIEDEDWQEIIPAKKVKGTSFLYEICALPFFAYDLCLGDTVRTDEKGKVLEAVESARRFGFRIFIPSQAPHDTSKNVINELQKHECHIEYNTSEYFGVDVPNELQASHISGILQEAGDKGLLKYETVRT